MAESNYEEIRKRNIAERKAEFAEFLKELKAETSDFAKVLVKPKSKKKIDDYSSDDETENLPPKRKRQRRSLAYTKFSKTYNTRSRSRRTSENIFDDDKNSKNIDPDDSDTDPELLRRLVPKGRPLKVIFPWAKTFEREMEMASMDKWDVDKELAEENDYSEEDDYDLKRRLKKKREIQRVSKSVYDPNTVPSVDEITDAMLANVAEKATGKIYNKYNGTSCHQCRQKTTDTKTVCRSGECIGVRGQFCGPCLRGRYGEDAITVLKDPNWACPPCRGLCNCSICRTRNGQRPTGILAPVAQEEGFSSVMDYLQATNDDDDDDDDDVEAEIVSNNT